MIALALGLALAFAPGPDDPVCEPGQTVEVDHCVQGQLAGETTGRELDEPAPSPIDLPVLPPAGDVAPAQRTYTLAATGVPTAPYVAIATALVGAGIILRRLSARSARPSACRARTRMSDREHRTTP